VASTQRLEGQVAVVTGGSSGIGAGTVRRFVAEGCRVLIADVQREAGELLAKELGDRACFRACDVTQEEDIAAAVDEAVGRFGRLDVMFNNAGIIGATGPVARSVTADVDLTFAVILRGTFLGMKHAARVMEPNHSGVILSTSSPAGLVGGMGAHAYSAAKAGVIGLTQSVAAELRPKGIRVNAIVPGAVVTAMTADIVVGDAGDLDGATEALQATALMSRPGLPEDIAAAALYLASDDAAFVTGSTLVVDGGLTWAPGTSPYATGEYETPVGLLEAGRRTRANDTANDDTGGAP
jgi:NAD(P)-dependent dehydrogenase (short-subunit alcohol dehydrogenase family)